MHLTMTGGSKRGLNYLENVCLKGLDYFENVCIQTPELFFNTGKLYTDFTPKVSTIPPLFLVILNCPSLRGLRESTTTLDDQCWCFSLN